MMPVTVPLRRSPSDLVIDPDTDPFCVGLNVIVFATLMFFEQYPQTGNRRRPCTRALGCPVQFPW
jgi:hypothetical protein